MWMKDFTKFLKAIGLRQCICNPCIFYKHSKGKLTLMLAVYVDNTLVARTDKEVRWLYKKVTGQYSTTKLGKLRKHLGVWYNWKTDDCRESYIKMMLPKLVDNAVAKYEELSKEKIKQASTPGTPGKILRKQQRR